MSFAASLLMLGAAAVPQSGADAPRPPVPSAAPAPAPQAPPAAHGVVATAQATAVILRPAVIRLEQLGSGRQWRQTGDTFFRQIRRDGWRVTVDFN